MVDSGGVFRLYRSIDLFWSLPYVAADHCGVGCTHAGYSDFHWNATKGDQQRRSRMLPFDFFSAPQRQCANRAFLRFKPYEDV